ncbi:MAG TPA: pectate lyase [Polyangiaceae bacterium]
MRAFGKSVLVGALLLSVACGGAEPGSGDAPGAGGVGSTSGGQPNTGSSTVSTSSSSSTGSGGSTGSQGAGGSGGSTTATGSGGMSATGVGGSGGRFSTSGTGGTAAGGTAGGGAGGMLADACSTWPDAMGSQNVSSTIDVSGSYDGEFRRFVGTGSLGSSGQGEDQDPIFVLAPGATLRNVILGNPAADGVHCEGDCTLENVWWEDVGEDAATFEGESSSARMTVRCGGARGADDKVFQHNGGGTLTIQDFQADGFGKLYRSCGNCNDQYERHVILQRVTARNGSSLVGVNTNYGDTADFEAITIFGDIVICERYTGNDSGAEPFKTGEGSDSQYCRYENSDITRR